VSIELWDGRDAVLVDTSAWVHARRVPEARERLFAAIERGDVAWCWPVRYELTFEAPNPGGIVSVDGTLDGLREIAVIAPFSEACSRRCASWRTRVLTEPTAYL
jgi:hypothetical protein